MKKRKKTKILAISLAVAILLMIFIAMGIWLKSRTTRQSIRHQTQHVFIVDENVEIQHEAVRRHLGGWYYVWD